MKISRKSFKNNKFFLLKLQVLKLDNPKTNEFSALEIKTFFWHQNEHHTIFRPDYDTDRKK